MEAFVGVLFALIKNLRKRKTGIISTSRSTFIVIFVADVIIRLFGFMQTYPERTDGNYFSQARQEKLDSWYWVHTPNTVISNKKKEFDFERNVNSIGISEQEIKKDKGSKFRILAIGDSFTEGVGASYEESWVKRMETRWKEQNVQTINAGIGGSDPVYELALYRDKLTEYNADLVVLTINSTDITDIIGRGGFDRFREDGTAGKDAPSWEWIYASNHLFRMIMHGAFNYNSGLIKDANSEESKQNALKIIKEAIQQFNELVKEEKTEFLIVLQPSLQEFENGKHTPFFGQLELAKYLESNGINYLDASIEIKKKGTSIPDYYYPIDTHFNKKGYALFGETVYKKIESLGFMD
jgi:lysophospholipase L1-like esterase